MDYHKKKELAAREIKGIIKTLQKDPTSNTKLSWLTIQFQEAYGFSEKTIRKMLEPYVQEGMIKIEENLIFAISNKQMEDATLCP